VSSQSIQIVSRETNDVVPAELLSGMTPSDLLVIENEWQPERSQIMQKLLALGIPREQWPQSLHWNWSRKAPLLQLLESQGFGIVCEGKWQGVAMTKSSPLYVAKSCDEKGKPLVYVDFLEVAPWNWVIPEIGQRGRFRSIGSVLLWRAIKFSEEEGFHGRLGLHSLRQSEWFYDKAGLTPLGRDASKQNLLYFELSRVAAQAILQRGEKHE
jgi:hypothetical protein